MMFSSAGQSTKTGLNCSLRLLVNGVLSLVVEPSERLIEAIAEEMDFLEFM